MARNTGDLLNLDIDKLFEHHKIEEIVEIEKLLNAEIEKKRIELRSMVGDRYKDVLAASDAIKNMKTISQDIVHNIQKITDTCENLLTGSSEKTVESSIGDDKSKLGERVLIVQVRLAMFMNEQIWIALDSSDNLTATQFYLLGQHIHLGLTFTKEEYLDRVPILKQIKSNLQILRDQIFMKIKQKLESVEITAEETSSNLNALLLLQNQSTNDLLSIFIEHRKTALHTVIHTSYERVRSQVVAMVRCLITTIHLLHDCFICYGNKQRGLIWQQLDDIVQDSSSPTLSKVELPITSLIAYIPDIIKEFRPKYKSIVEQPLREGIGLDDWLQNTRETIKKGLVSSLNLITNVKGLYSIKEEALKIDLPKEWDKICLDTQLGQGFNVWFYFFQTLITARAKELITSKIQSDMQNVLEEITMMFNSKIKSHQNENDLRWYIWSEDSVDISRQENKHKGLSMKTSGYSLNVVNLCEKFNNKYLDLLVDVSEYLYGVQFDIQSDVIPLSGAKIRKAKSDKVELENHLRKYSVTNCTHLVEFLQDFISSERNKDKANTIICARFLQAVTILCPHFKKCCTLNGSTEDWTVLCTNFFKASINFWQNWINRCVQNTSRDLRKEFAEIGPCSMVSILPRWDTIEVQEQTEEKIFKSYIKVPLKPSLILHNILMKLNDELSYVLPHTLPKQVHLEFVEKNVERILEQYREILKTDLNQNQALQFLFDVKFLTTFCIPRENIALVSTSQDICDKLRTKIDPFDLNVFYSYLQNNVKRAVVQSQVILGCLLPSSAQLANLGVPEKIKDPENEPSILALSTPSVSSWFPLLPISAPSQKSAIPSNSMQTDKTPSPKPARHTPKKSQDPATAVRSGAAAIFGGLATDWFS